MSRENYAPVISGAIAVVSKNNLMKAPKDFLKRELKRCEVRLRKINSTIGFEIKYGDYSPLTSPLQEEKEKKMDKILKIKEAIGGLK